MKKTTSIIWGLGLCIAASPLHAQVGVPNDSIEFCNDLNEHGNSQSEIEIGPDGNMYVIARTNETSGSGFTQINYLGEGVSPEIIEIAPPGLDSFGGVVFAGDTVLYFHHNAENKSGIRSGVVVPYDISPNNELVETGRIFMPTVDGHSITSQLHVIEAEQDQFVVAINTELDSGSTIIRVFVYRFVGNSWDVDAVIDRTAGTSVLGLAIEGDVLVIGYGDDVVKLYERNNGSGEWEFVQDILPFEYAPDPSIVDYQSPQKFGNVIEMENGMIAISDHDMEIVDPAFGTSPNAGACFVYSYSNGVVSEEAILFEYDGTNDSFPRVFGGSLDFSDDGQALVVGANAFDWSNDFSYYGASFVYETSNFDIAPTVYFDNLSPDLSQVFGRSVRFSGTTLSIFSEAFISNSKDCFGLNRPAILRYSDAYDVPLPCNEADFAPDFGVLNFADVSAFLLAYGNEDPIADFNGDGVLNFIDVSLFLVLYGAGCP